MTTTINASTTNGLVQTADGSGVLEFQSNGTAAAGVSSSNFQMNSGYGSVATSYGCRAWVNFNGTGTPAIRGSGNVSSITDNGTGDYTVNFTTSMPDANYCALFTTSGDASAATMAYEANTGANRTSATVSSIKVNLATNGGSPADRASVNVSIFR